MSAAPLQPLRFGAVILAAGASTRLGRPKQLLEIEGRPLVARAAEAALAAGASPVVVVLGANSELIRPALQGLDIGLVLNQDWAEGMASSVRAGLHALGQITLRLDAVLLTVCDQPAFDADSVRRLLAALQGSSRGIAAARYAGRHAVPAIFRRKHFFSLARLKGDQGARALLQEKAEDVVAVELPDLALDLDTPDDLDRWRDRQGGGDKGMG
jgi:molybdenum cofactor cytidylyltransferase